LYMPVYLLSLLLNLLCRLCTGKTEAIVMEAYYRVCFEDWAYSAGSSSQADINWSGWILWFFVTSIYVASVMLILFGAFAGSALLKILARVGLLAYRGDRRLASKTALLKWEKVNGIRVRCWPFVRQACIVRGFFPFHQGFLFVQGDSNMNGVGFMNPEF